VLKCNCNKNFIIQGFKVLFNFGLYTDLNSFQSERISVVHIVNHERPCRHPRPAASVRPGQELHRGGGRQLRDRVPLLRQVRGWEGRDRVM